MFWKRRPCNCAEAARIMSMYGGEYPACERHQPLKRETMLEALDKELAEITAKQERYKSLARSKAQLLGSVNRALVYAYTFSVQMPDYYREQFKELRADIARTPLKMYEEDGGFTFDTQLMRHQVLSSAWAKYREQELNERWEREKRLVAAKKRMRKMKPARVNPSNGIQMRSGSTRSAY